MRTILDHWQSYSRDVIPANAPPRQVTECRRAFYAGAQAMLAITAEIGEPTVSEDAGMHILEGLHDECRRFGAEIAAGRA